VGFDARDVVVTVDFAVADNPRSCHVSFLSAMRTCEFLIASRPSELAKAQSQMPEDFRIRMHVPTQIRRRQMKRSSSPIGFCSDTFELSIPPRRPRVGHIEFLNCFPLLWGLARTGSLLDMELVKDTPNHLSDALVSGALDISPISLIEFFENSEDLVVLPNMAIGSDGPVMSCIIISRLPLRQLDKLPVALTSTSRTSVRLAELLLSDLVGVQPEYFLSSADLATMMTEAPAAVLIGDAALQAAQYEAPRLSWEVHDLGQMWRDWTGLPFVFAVFAAHRKFAESEPDLVSRVHTALLHARDLSLTNIDQVCEQAANWNVFDAATLKQYYTLALDFTLTDRHLSGIAEFSEKITSRRSRFPSEGQFTQRG
jgi:chorismate dehydratase